MGWLHGPGKPIGDLGFEHCTPTGTSRALAWRAPCRALASLEQASLPRAESALQPVVTSLLSGAAPSTCQPKPTHLPLILRTRTWQMGLIRLLRLTTGETEAQRGHIRDDEMQQKECGLNVSWASWRPGAALGNQTHIHSFRHPFTHSTDTS